LKQSIPQRRSRRFLLTASISFGAVAVLIAGGVSASKRSPSSSSKSSTTSAPPVRAGVAGRAIAPSFPLPAPPLTGQLYFRINQGNDVQLGDINSDGSGRHTIYFGGGNTSGNPQNIGMFNGNETSVAVDTAAGLVFSVGVGNHGSYDAFSVHNLNRRSDLNDGVWS
jgi:hypothetical protein